MVPPFGSCRGEPFGGLGLRRLEHFEHGSVGLGPRLQRIAAVNEQRRCVLQHDGRAGRPGEAGEPAQALGGGRQELVLMLVAVGHEEALELAGLELPPERRHALGHRGRRTDLFEALKHGSPCKAGLAAINPQTRAACCHAAAAGWSIRREGFANSSLKPSDRKRDSTCRAWRSRRPESTQMPPGRSARAKAGARSSRGRSRILANSRSALARRNAGCATPSASTTVTRD